MEQLNYSLKKEARLAGFFYLLCVLTGIYAMVYLPSKVDMNGSAGEVANHIISNEFIFRVGILTRLVSSIPWVLLSLSLYRLMKGVNGFQAKLMFAWMALSVPIGFIAESMNISALMIAKGELLKSLDVVQRSEYAFLFLKLHGYITSVSELFWGLWLLPFGFLIYKSGFIPRILGVLLFLGGVSYIIEWVIFLAFPAYESSISSYRMLFGSVGEISIMLWLLIKGVKDK